MRAKICGTGAYVPENYYDNNDLITIPLDQRFYPSQNAKLFFKKYNKNFSIENNKLFRYISFCLRK